MIMFMIKIIKCEILGNVLDLDGRAFSFTVNAMNEFGLLLGLFIYLLNFAYN